MIHNKQQLRACEENLGSSGLVVAKDDLQDPSSWSSSPILLLRDIHSKILPEYNCKEGCAPSQSHVNVGASGRLSSQDGVSQQQQISPLFIPELNLLVESSFVRDESVVSNDAITSSPHSIGSPNSR